MGIFLFALDRTIHSSWIIFKPYQTIYGFFCAMWAFRGLLNILGGLSVRPNVLLMTKGILKEAYK